MSASFHSTLTIPSILVDGVAGVYVCKYVDLLDRLSESPEVELSGLFYREVEHRLASHDLTVLATHRKFYFVSSNHESSTL